MLEWRSNQESLWQSEHNRNTSANYHYEDRAEPESKIKEELSQATQPSENNAGKKVFFSSMLEEILDIRNVQKAFKQVTANKGAGGIDGMQTDELRDYLNANWQTLRKEILEGNYKPQPVCKVEIPKPQGGTRMLGHTDRNRQAVAASHCPMAKPKERRRLLQSQLRVQTRTQRPSGSIAGANLSQRWL